MKQLGIEPILLLAQVVNFSIIVVVLTKLLYKPVLSALERRKKKIEEGLALVERMQQEEEKLGARKEKLLLEARKEGHLILEDARIQAKEEEKEILVHARGEAEAIIAKGKAEVGRLKDEARQSLRAESSELAIAIAKRLLTKTLTSGDKHTILAKHLKDIESLPKE